MMKIYRLDVFDIYGFPRETTCRDLIFNVGACDSNGRLMTKETHFLTEKEAWLTSMKYSLKRLQDVNCRIQSQVDDFQSELEMFERFIDQFTLFNMEI